MFFFGYETEEGIKSRYRKISKCFHPDVGGDVDLMQELNAEYEKAIRQLREKKSEAQRVKKIIDDLWDMYFDKVCAILCWAEENPKFDDSFILNIKSVLESGRLLTKAQMNAVDNIIRKFKIEWENNVEETEP